VTTNVTATRSEKLSFWTKSAYAIGTLGDAVGAGTIIPFWHLFFLTEVVKLNPVLAGVSILVGKIWDAINDPLIGALSDRTRTRWGRRRPYLLFGALPFGISFALLWIIPPIQNQVLLCLYFALMYILYDTAFTLVDCPYDALTPELTQDHDERTSLITFRMFVSIVGGLVAAILLSEVIFPNFPGDQRAAFKTVGITLGAAFVLPMWITFLGTRERPEFQVEEAPSLREGLGYVLRNKEWRYALAMGLLSWMPVDLASAVFPYFLIYWVGMSMGDASLVLAVILLSAALFLPVVLWLSRRFEKKTAFIIASASWAIIMLGILLVPKGAITLTYVIAALTGFGVSSAHLLPRAMTPDVLEVDELMSGKRQEGIYSGFSVFVRKLSIGLVLGMVGPALAWSGYIEGAEAQSPGALTAIRLLMSVLPALLLTAASIVAWFYPLTRKRHAEILKELARRRGTE